MLQVRDLMCIDGVSCWEPETLGPCVCVVPAEMDAADAARCMLRHNARRALVVDNGTLVGDLALTDALTGILATCDDQRAA